MRIRRILAVGLGIVLGVAAAPLAQVWFEWQGSLATRGLHTIVVAVQPLRFGIELKAEHLREITWPAGPTPAGSFEKISDLLTAEGRRVVLSPIEPSEPVLRWKVTGPGERATLSAVVVEGMRAMTVDINDVNGVAHMVLPGDRVDIMLTRSNFTDILLQNVKILAIDQVAYARQDKPEWGATVTLEVNTIDAQKLTLAQTVGSLSLALRAAGNDELYPAFEKYAGDRENDAAAPRRITMSDLGPSFEIYAGEQKSEGFKQRIRARGDFPHSPFKCEFPYGPCIDLLEPAGLRIVN